MKTSTTVTSTVFRWEQLRQQNMTTDHMSPCCQQHFVVQFCGGQSLACCQIYKVWGMCNQKIMDLLCDIFVAANFLPDGMACWWSTCVRKKQIYITRARRFCVTNGKTWPFSGWEGGFTTTLISGGGSSFIFVKVLVEFYCETIVNAMKELVNLRYLR